MSESVIKEITEEIIEKVENNGEPPKDAVKIDYAPAANGDRERPWHLTNKAMTMGVLGEGEEIPIVSMFEPNLKKLKETDWVKIKVNDRHYMACKKSFLLMTNCICEMKHDVTETVVTHLLIHSPETENNTKNKEFWKMTFRKYLRLGAMSWEDARKEVKNPEGAVEGELEMKTLSDEIERLDVGVVEEKES